jgi:hypothetical protein
LQRFDLWQGISSTLLTRAYRHRLPMGKFFVSPLALQTQHAVLRYQGRDTAHTELGGFFNQPIHAVIGGHHYGQMHLMVCFSLNGMVRADKNPHIVSSHMFNHSVKLSAGTIKQRGGLARLHTQNLYMACSRSRQRDAITCH